MTRSYQRVAFVLLLACSACKSAASDDAEQGKQGSTGGLGGSVESNGSSNPSGGKGGDDKPTSPNGSGGDQSSEQPPGGGKGGNSSGGGSGGTTDPNDPALPPGGSGGQSGVNDPDAGTPPPQGPVDAGELGDAMIGMIGTESCCAVHDSPGCSNADLQVCVCEKIATCCTDKWDEACVLIVEGRWCQEGVRDCVCLDGQGQWGQHACCDSSWGSTCDTTARSKCGAKRGCF
jgi:hypothetical protein